MYDCIVIGGGPAGITAGIYLRRKRLKTLLISENFVGQVGLTGIIENWPGEKQITGPELMINFTEHLQEHAPEINEERVISVAKEGDLFTVKTESKELKAKTIVVATGRKQRELGAPGEKKFTGKGVVYCTTCDAPLFTNKRVIIIGGGNAGFEAAIELKKYTSDVTLTDRDMYHLADECLVEDAVKEGVVIKKETVVKEIIGDSFVEEVILYNTTTGEQYKEAVDGVFVQIGSDAANRIVQGLVEVDERGDIVTDNLCRTSTEGLFASGDVTNVRDKQIVVATGEGAKAGLSVYHYLKNKKY